MLNTIFDFLRMRHLPDERKLHPHIFGDMPNPELTVGSIVLRTLIKTAFLLPVLWFSVEYFHLQYYWIVIVFIIFAVIVYPAFRQYERFYDQQRKTAPDLLCASCKHFDTTGVLCLLHDEHVSQHHIPCGGDSWESKQFSS